MNYVLVTPVKNEIAHFSKLRESILSQTIKPVLWIVVDGGSSDGTCELATRLSEAHRWIEVVKQQSVNHIEHAHIKIARAVNEGFSHAIRLASERGIEFEYVAKTDATPMLPPTFFEKLLDAIRTDSDIAVVCGKQRFMIEGKELVIDTSEELSFSGFTDVRLYRRDFFETTEGYPLTPSFDVVHLIEAKRMGRKAQIVEDAVFIEDRLGGSKTGKWNGYMLKGATLHFLGYRPSTMLLSAGYYSIKLEPHYLGIALAFGFFSSAVNRRPRIQDPTIREFFGRNRSKEIVSAIVRRLHDA